MEPALKTDLPQDPVHDGVRGALRRARDLTFVRERPVDSQLALVVAVSGGEDSHTLLHTLVSLRDEQLLQLVVAHFDHGLRPESKQEAQFVEYLAGQYDLPFYLGSADARPHAANVEAWARESRYRFLGDCLVKCGADFIVTAHHKNDQAETVLFRMMTGRMLTDAFAIAALHEERRLLRPLLAVSRQEIEDYSVKNQLSFVVDSSNADLDRTRNRIRHTLVPELEQEYNPRVVDALAAVSVRLGEDESALWSVARSMLGQDTAGTTASFLLELPPALRWRVLQLVAERQIGEPARLLGYRRLTELVDRVASGWRPNGPIDIGFGVKFSLNGPPNGSGVLNFGTRDIALGEVRGGLPESSSVLPVPGEVQRQYHDGSSAKLVARVVPREEFQPDEVTVPFTRYRSGELPPALSVFFDARKLHCAEVNCAELIVRERRDGDLMRVMNRGSRKVKKLLQESRVKTELRDQLPLVELGGEILWIPGIARGEMGAVEDSSDLLLEIRYLREGARTGGSR